jgi:hypothetical protein
VTDDELRRLWNAGLSINTIAARSGVTRGSMANRIRRLRRKEGMERWPYRDNPIVPGTSAPRARRPIRAGVSTLPPLPSLEGHGQAPRR